MRQQASSDKNRPAAVLNEAEADRRLWRARYPAWWSNIDEVIPTPMTTQADQEKLDEAFRHIDANDDGLLSRAEVIKACRGDERIRALLAHVDIPGELEVLEALHLSNATRESSRRNIVEIVPRQIEGSKSIERRQ